MPRWFRGVTAGGLGIVAMAGLLLALVPVAPTAVRGASAFVTPTAPEMLMGDAVRGQMRHEMLGCASCHGADARGEIGPMSSGTRLTFDEMREVVRSGRMFGEAYGVDAASDQDLADIYAWLLTRPAG